MQHKDPSQGLSELSTQPSGLKMFFFVFHELFFCFSNVNYVHQTPLHTLCSTEFGFSVFFLPREQMNSPDRNMKSITPFFIIYSLIAAFAKYEYITYY